MRAARLAVLAAVPAVVLAVVLSLIGVSAAALNPASAGAAPATGVVPTGGATSHPHDYQGGV